MLMLSEVLWDLSSEKPQEVASMLFYTLRNRKHAVVPVSAVELGSTETQVL